MYSTRLLAVAAVLLTSSCSYFVYHSDLYFLLVDHIGYFPYMALTPLASICLLRLIPCGLSDKLMILFCILVYIDLACWFIAGYGYDVLIVYGWIQWAAFIVEILLFIPKGVINGIITAICRYAPAGIFEQTQRSAYNRFDNLQSDSAEN